MASQLQEHYKGYYKQMNQLQIPYLKEKLITIKNQLDENEKNKNPSDLQLEEIKYMKTFMNETALFLEREKKKLNEKANLLYNTWLALKKERETQKFISTNVKLTVLKFPSR